MKYLYAPMYRPPAHATLPPGWTLEERGTLGHYPERRDLSTGSFRFGLVSYGWKLPFDMVEKWELQYIDYRPDGIMDRLKGSRYE